MERTCFGRYAPASLMRGYCKVNGVSRGNSRTRTLEGRATSDISCDIALATDEKRSDGTKTPESGGKR
jgi:hypothetical protein